MSVELRHRSNGHRAQTPAAVDCNSSKKTAALGESRPAVLLGSSCNHLAVGARAQEYQNAHEMRWQSDVKNKTRHIIRATGRTSKALLSLFGHATGNVCLVSPRQTT